MVLFVYFIALILSLLAWIGSLLSMIFSAIGYVTVGISDALDSWFKCMRDYSQRLVDSREF